MSSYLGLAVALIVTATLGLAPAQADERAPSEVSIAARAAAVQAITDLRRIRTPNGIERLERVAIGGVPQWLSLRGRDRGNPVLLMIHGGPGTPTMHLDWAYQNGWEDYFTVVNWDQRGAGKNWQGSDHDALAPTVTLAQLVKDAAEVTDWLRREFGKRKIIVMGFSYGSQIGAQLAMERPDAIAAYVGVGQAFDDRGEAEVYRGALTRATAAGNQDAIAALTALAPYPSADGSISIASALAVRKWVKRYNGGWYGWPDFQLLYELPLLAPEYDDHDLRDWIEANSWFGRSIGELAPNNPLASQGFHFHVPIVFMMGRYDLMTPYETAKTYFDRITSPSKSFVTFEHSSHFVMLEEPGKFLVTLVEAVRPLAMKSERP